MNTGIAKFLYTRKLPDGAVAIAYVKADPSYASDLIDVDNIVTTGPLGIWKFSTDGVGQVDPLSAPAPISAPGLGSVVTISGSRTYIFDSQFFEMTNVLSAAGAPLFYKHILNSYADSITITNNAGDLVLTDVKIVQGKLYHALSSGLYWIRYIDVYGIAQKEMLKFNPVIIETQNFATPESYVLSGRAVLLTDVTLMHVRFTDYSIFSISTPYGNLPNVPWFPRVRFPASALVPEWVGQSFNPQRPYLLASWVTGKVLDPHVLQLERPFIFPDNNHWPDVIVFDKDYVIKYALEGTAPEIASRRGNSYPWKRGQILDVDFQTAQIRVLPDLAPDDIIFGFYSYRERDVVLSAIDCNPFTNPSVRNCVVRIYARTDSDPFRRLFYQVIDYTGNEIELLTNDPLPVAGTWKTNPHITLIGDLFIGASISPRNLTITDARVRGGGLLPAAQVIPQAAHFWDIGFLDGKPYPVGGTLVVNLPSSILATMSRSEIQQRVDKTIPMGCLAVIRYYDTTTFEELV